MLWIYGLFAFRIAYMQGKKEKPPFVKSDSPERKQDEKIIPGELLCPVCKDLLTDAVVAPCCGNSACDECKYWLYSTAILLFLLTVKTWHCGIGFKVKCSKKYIENMWGGLHSFNTSFNDVMFQPKDLTQSEN